MDKNKTSVSVILFISSIFLAIGLAESKVKDGSKNPSWADYYETAKLHKTTHLKSKPELDKASQKRLVGRHVCTHNKVVMKPMKHTESYCKPTYQTYIRRCDHTSSTYCTGYRVMYELAFRIVEKIVAHTEVSYSCCPGWTHSNWSRECKKALCSNQCLNGGSCLKPNQCLCPRGWTGRNCEIDSSKENDTSSQREMEDLKRRVLRLEKNMASLLEMKSRFENLNQIVNRFLSEKPLKEERSIKNGDKKDSSTDETPDEGITDPKDLVVETAEDRIQSLSEQMAILEERLADCTCTNKDYISIPPPAR